MTPFAYVVMGWVALGVTVAVWMGRRGHASFTWAVLVGVLGPLGLPLVFSAVRDERAADHAARVVEQGEAGPGSVDVVVGVDGSAAGVAALDLVVSLLGSRLGRLCLATVVDYDQGGVGPSSRTVEARAMLDTVAARIGRPIPMLVVLKGRPAQALAAFASQEGFELVAVGARGRGNSAALLGSVADHLTRESTVPVLVGGVSDRTDGQHAVNVVNVVEVASALGADV